MPKNSYFIDSCIFLGTQVEDKNTHACKGFISRINNDVFIGYISPFVTGEMINSILYAENIKTKTKFDILHAIFDMLISTKLENFVLLNNDMKIYTEIRDADERISESDLMHVVCAKILDIPLVTTDDMMLKSNGLKPYVNIIYPSKCY